MGGDVDVDDFLDGVDGAQQKGARLPEPGLGEYQMRVEALTFGQTGFGDDLCRLTGEITEAAPGAEQKPGAIVSIGIFRDKFGYYLGDLRALAGAISGEGPLVRDGKAKLKAYAAGEIPIQDVMIRVTGTPATDKDGNVKTNAKKGGKPFVRYAYAAVRSSGKAKKSA